jgi:hypothetical protein
MIQLYAYSYCTVLYSTVLYSSCITKDLFEISVDFIQNPLHIPEFTGSRNNDYSS